MHRQNIPYSHSLTRLFFAEFSQEEIPVIKPHNVVQYRPKREMVPLSIIFAIAASVLAVGVSATKVISPSNPLIWYHGRWDWGRGTWW